MQQSVPVAALSEPAKKSAAAAAQQQVSWQGRYCETFMLHEAGAGGSPNSKADLTAALGAYTQLAVQTHFAPRPLVAVVVAVHRCAARAVAGLAVFDALSPLSTAARGLRQAVFGV
jgi:hypothetical protein